MAQTVLEITFTHENAGVDGHQVDITVEALMGTPPVFADNDGVLTWTVDANIISTGTDILDFVWQQI